MSFEATLWEQLERLRTRKIPALALAPNDAEAILKEVETLQRIVQEVTSGEALLVRNVYDSIVGFDRWV